MKAKIEKIFRELYERKGIRMIAAECCPDHIHILIGILLKYSVSEIVVETITLIQLGKTQKICEYSFKGRTDGRSNQFK